MSVEVILSPSRILLNTSRILIHWHRFWRKRFQGRVIFITTHVGLVRTYVHWLYLRICCYNKQKWNLNDWIIGNRRKLLWKTIKGLKYAHCAPHSNNWKCISTIIQLFYETCANKIPIDSSNKTICISTFFGNNYCPKHYLITIYIGIGIFLPKCR